MPMFQKYLAASGLAVFAALAVAGPGKADPPPVNPIVIDYLKKQKFNIQMQHMAKELQRMQIKRPLVIPPGPRCLSCPPKVLAGR
ncbi:MAG: hypothetical protein KDJ47_18245 [Hyphomicrobiaceae bacterium]|nr:hypothetical protein [Hyphomicrobiaceae bacterium]